MNGDLSWGEIISIVVLYYAVLNFIVLGLTGGLKEVLDNFAKEEAKKIKEDRTLQPQSNIIVSKNDDNRFDVKAKKYCNCAVSSKKQNNRDLTLKEIRDIIRDISYGIEKDDPEGSRIVTISDTLAWKITNSLDLWNYKYKRLDYIRIKLVLEEL